MMGRSWYVEVESLLQHKKNRKLGNKRNSRPLPKIINPALVEPLPPLPIRSSKPLVTKETTNASFLTPLTYETDAKPRLPELSKGTYRLASNQTFLSHLAIGAISLFITLSTIALGVEYLSPELYQRANMKMATVADFLQLTVSPQAPLASLKESGPEGIQNVSSAYSSLKNKILSWVGMGTPEIPPLVAAPKVAAADAATQNGMVVVPKGNHDETVAKVKSAFSDEVSVTLDASGDAGVVTPKFHKGDDTENYTFVLVPVKPKK